MFGLMFFHLWFILSLCSVKMLFFCWFMFGCFFGLFRIGWDWTQLLVYARCLAYFEDILVYVRLCLVYVWVLFGVCMVYGWLMFGLCVVYVWFGLCVGLCSAYVWFMSGFIVVSWGFMFGLCLVCARFMFGV